MSSTAYKAEVGNGAAFAGVDQGIDFTGKAQVFALGNGVVTRIVKAGSGWAGQGALLVYRLIDGPGKGRYVYVAEDFAIDPKLKIGSAVKQGQTIGSATGSGLAPGIETGWADKNGHAFGSPFPRQPTSFGQDFDAFVRALSGGKTPDPPAGGSSGSGSGSSQDGFDQQVQKQKDAQGPVADVLSGDPGSALSGITGWIQGTASTGLAYVVLTMLGLAFLVFGVLDALGYSPKRVASAPLRAAAKGGEVIPF